MLKIVKFKLLEVFRIISSIYELLECAFDTAPVKSLKELRPCEFILGPINFTGNIEDVDTDVREVIFCGTASVSAINTNLRTLSFLKFEKHYFSTRHSQFSLFYLEGQSGTSYKLLFVGYFIPDLSMSVLPAL